MLVILSGFAPNFSRRREKAKNLLSQDETPSAAPLDVPFDRLRMHSGGASGQALRWLHAATEYMGPTRSG